MAARFFLNKAISKIERIDKEALTKLALQLTQEKKLFEDLVEHLPIGVAVVDSAMNVRAMNRLMKVLLAGSDTNHTVERLKQVCSDTDFYQQLSRAVKSQVEIYDEPYEIYHPRHVRGTWNLRRLGPTIKNERSENLFAFFVQSESGKEERQKEKHHAEKLISILTLASGIAHELGNPLNSIGVHLQLLAADIAKLPEPHRTKLRKSVEIVAEESSRLDKIIRNFLKSTRQKPIAFQIANIHDVIQQTLTLLKPELKESKISFKTSFDATLPEFYIDTERLSQVFINLIKNAIQAMPRGGVLTVGTFRRKGSCEISISDTGIGIKQNDLPKIFDAYYTTKEEGSGLGLVISYQIIREHSGKIDVQSKPGKGTTIVVTLPIRKEKLQLPAPNEKKENHETFI